MRSYPTTHARRHQPGSAPAASTRAIARRRPGRSRRRRKAAIARRAKPPQLAAPPGPNAAMRTAWGAMSALARRQVWAGVRRPSRSSPNVRISTASTVRRRAGSPRKPCFPAEGGAGASSIPANADRRSGRIGEARRSSARPAKQPPASQPTHCSFRTNRAVGNAGLVPSQREPTSRLQIRRSCMTSKRPELSPSG